jgi:hypothetical protein
MAITAPELSQEEIDRLADRGWEIYEDQLKPLLEPAYNGQTVAIHLDTGDYAIGANSPAAMRAMHERRPEGMVMTKIIGPEREDPTLYRMLASQIAASRRK